MEKTKRPYYIALAVLLMAAILLSSVIGGLLYRRSGSDKLVELSNDLHQSLRAGFTNIKIKDKSSALSAVDSVKGELGIRDVGEELKVSKVTKNGSDRYYRMQQYHDGLPVYGREVIVGADKNGDALSLNTNYNPIGGELSTTPKTDQKTVNKNVKKALEKENKGLYTSATTVTSKTTEAKKTKETKKATEATKATEVTKASTTKESSSERQDGGSIIIEELTKNALCICDMFTKGEAVLAYQLFVQTAVETYTALVDATTGAVIKMLPETCEYHTACYSPGGAGFVASYNEELGSYLLADEEQKFLTMNWNNGNSSWAQKAWYVDSADNVFGNTAGEKSYEHEKGVQLYRSLQWVRNYYQERLGESADDYLVAFYNDSVQNGGNAFATIRNDIDCVGVPKGEYVGVISVGSQIPITAFDVFAHEYTHRVDKNVARLIYQGESGALAEAFADIMGELLEAKNKNTDPDWQMSTFRLLSDPESNGYPSTYKGKNWASTYSDVDHGGVHTNSTVLSYAAYLMWSGMGNRVNGIDEEDLMSLWVSALHRFKSDETFQQAADAVYSVAYARSLQGDLSETQLKTVEQAFAKVGLPVAGTGSITEVVAPEKESKKNETIDVVKTMRYAVGPTEWEASYDYDLVNKVLNVTDREVESYDGWRDPGEQISSDDALLWNGMLQAHPELMLSYSADTLFEDLLLLAYNPLITSGRITEIHKKTIMNQDETTEYVTTLKVNDGKLMELHENIVDGDYMADLRYEYDSQGRVIAIEINGFETIEEWDETLLRMKYEDLNGSTKITMTKPQGQYIYTYIYSGQVGTNGLISDVDFILRDEEYTETLDSKPVAKVFHDLDGTAKYDQQGHLTSLSYVSEEPNPTSVLSYDSRGNLISAGTKSNPKMNTFTYQTLKLS